MLNFRKLKQDFSPAILKEGRVFFEKSAIAWAKIMKLSGQAVRLKSRVTGNFDKAYSCELEIDRRESMVVYSDCDCSHKYDCQHLAALMFYLEDHFESIVVAYSKEMDLEKAKDVDEEEKETLRETFKEAESKDHVRRSKKNQKELLNEYIEASQVLGKSPFFLPQENFVLDKAEIAVVVLPSSTQTTIDIQLALRLPFRSKPLAVPYVKEFFDAVRYGEGLYIGSRRYFFSPDSFDPLSRTVLASIMDFSRVLDAQDERGARVVQVDVEAFGSILAQVYEASTPGQQTRHTKDESASELLPLSCFYMGTLEEPLRRAASAAKLRFELDYLEAPNPKLLFVPQVMLEEVATKPEEIIFFECAHPGMIHKNVYYRFAPQLRRKHLRNMRVIRNIAIPEPLFGTFVENSLPELLRFAEVSNQEVIERFVTMPFVGQLQAECDVHYLDGELEVSLHFIYDGIKVPAAASKVHVDQILPFVKKDGVLARNLTEEQKVIEDLFQDALYDPSQGIYTFKNDKKIVEFMTDVIPRNQNRVKFNCPENLLDQYVYDDTHFTMSMKESDRIDAYRIELKVDGPLAGATVDQLWECLSARRGFIELPQKKIAKKKDGSANRPKILVLDLNRLAPVIQVFDELGLSVLDNHTEERPLWSLVTVEDNSFKGMPIAFSMSKGLKDLQQQMLGIKPLKSSSIPKEVNATLRAYQIDGVGWLERLRHMRLNGVLADDMGLGKTLQAIAAVSQHHLKHTKAISVIICPTSLVYNWKEEFLKFNPTLRILAVDGTPIQRKKLLDEANKFDVVITSYSLLQKDIDIYKDIGFAYAILDEAQQIKNRGTRNAKSVKMIRAQHRLVLTGTPIENSLDELWSLFDFLMPGLLSSYDRFVEKYIRHVGQTKTNSLEQLKRKVSPFILRRMKKDVLTELPPVSEIVYHCHLSDVQRDLYRSYAKSAREELSQLVKREGFDKVQIHVLATLTRLKQICCHPAIFAKDKAESGDSAKYEMLMELLQTLIEGKHKAVIFSQYTRMLNIISNDLEQQGIPFEYLDGASKDRMSIVKRFNEDPNIPIFLVSLKAGGTGLNLVGADTVIHYDMWWNPAVENQATDRVHRIGQKQSVSMYKLVTLNTIEEKIIDLQNRKKGIVKKIVSCDEEAMTKLTWEEVLELLQT